MPLKLNYYYGEEADQFCFYRIPKALFTDASYKALSLEAKVLYGLLLDRMGLSVRNRKMDEQGRVFIFFKLETALDMLGIGHNKGVRLFKELELIGLIERKKQGQGKPTVIYVKNFIPPDAQNPGPPDGSHHPDNPDTPEDTLPAGYGPEDGDSGEAESFRDASPGQPVTNCAAGDTPGNSTMERDFEPESGQGMSNQDRNPPPAETSQIGKSGLPALSDFPNQEVLTSQNGKSALPTPSDFPQSEVLTSQKRKSALPKSGTPDFPNREANNTDKSNTDFSNINLSPPAPSFPTRAELMAYRMTREERREEMDECREFVRDMIGYDLLLQEYPQDRLRIDGYVEILAEALCWEEPYLRIGQREYSMCEVRERLYQLGHEHICYVMDCMRNTTSQIANPRAYTLAALFNAPLTVDQYYDSMVARDMAQDSGGSSGWNYSDRDSCGFKYSSYPKNSYGGCGGGYGGYYSGERRAV